MKVVKIVDLDGEKHSFYPDTVNFINPATHGDYKFLLDRADYPDSESVLFVNAAAVMTLKVDELEDDA